ncbi:MAG: DNA-directed RNA polymerase subunit omega [Thermodesulfobacteriota bacterium]|nr:DNA-directed RNA polymerase subunit omega [Thermodesulfobacteriota bacterium]
MARITVEDCLKKVPSRFELVHLTAQRVRQIREGAEYLVSSPKNEDIVVALREIAAGKITQENMDELSEMELFSNIGATVTDEEESAEAPGSEETDEEAPDEGAEDEATEDEDATDDESDEIE